MRRLFLFFIIIFTVISCNRSFYRHSNVPKEGKYYRGSEDSHVFLKIENNIAYIDFITRFKVPLYYYSDTVQIIANEARKWHGDFVTLYEKNRKLIIEAQRHDFYGNLIKDGWKHKAVMKTNEENYDNLRNNYKNQTLFHRARSLFHSSDVKSGDIYRDLISKHQMIKKRLELEHNDFIIQFERFENELMKELELQK